MVKLLEQTIFHERIKMKQIIFTLLFLCFTQLSAHAEDNPQAMLVFDASGSMWGQINGKVKINIAKDALNNVVSNWDENVHLGLIAYGHRKKGDCNDIQTLIPIGQLDKNSMIAKVKAIKPKGKTPISRSIKKAAEDLRYTEEKATVILISDGKETCNADPCATAKSLENEGIDFVAHVIGFDVDKQTDKQLKCIADSTGGEYFSAKNAASLNDAMGKIAEKVKKDEPKPSVIKNPKKNLKITASETEGGKWVKAYHAIHKIIDGEEESNRTLGCYSRKKEACLKQIPVGKYVMHSSFNFFKKDTFFEIKAGETTKLNIVMGQTGKVEITAAKKEGGKWIKAYHMVYKIIDGEEDSSRTVGCYSRKKEACIKQIPVGKYIMHSTFNGFKKDTSFIIKAGKTTKLHVLFAQFNIKTKCTNMGAKVTHEIYTDNGQLLFEKETPCSVLVNVILDNGSYTLTTTMGNESKDTKFSIGSDYPNQIIIDMQQSKQESSHQDLIDADRQTQTSAKPEEKPVFTTQQQTRQIPKDNMLTKGLADLGKQMEAISKQNMAVNNEHKTNDETDTGLPSADELQGAMRQAGALLNGLRRLGKDLEKKPLQGAKETIRVAIPKYQTTIECYQKADDLDAVKQCEAIEKEMLESVQNEFQQATGFKSGKEMKVTEHSEWNDELRKETIAKKQIELKEMKLTLSCFDQGAGFLDLERCIKNNGKYTAKKSEFEQLGDLLNALGGMAKPVNKPTDKKQQENSDKDDADMMKELEIFSKQEK
jgi:Ca-activated chloride channel family protein